MAVIPDPGQSGSATSLRWVFCSKNRPPLPSGETSRGWGEGSLGDTEDGDSLYLRWTAHSRGRGREKGDVAVEAVPAPTAGPDPGHAVSRETLTLVQRTSGSRSPDSPVCHSQAQPPPPAGDLLLEAGEAAAAPAPRHTALGCAPPSRRTTWKAARGSGLTDTARSQRALGTVPKPRLCKAGGPPAAAWEGSRSPRGLQWLPLHPLEQNPMLRNRTHPATDPGPPPPYTATVSSRLSPGSRCCRTCSRRGGSSSLSSVVDSYSEAMPDSRKRSSSRPPSGGPRAPGSRKHSSFTKQSRLPKRLPAGRAGPAPRGGEGRSSGVGVVGSQSTGRAPGRKVISSRLSWDPTADRG